MGINRWVYRVITYVSLMRDEYPPLQLDQGPHEPPEPMADVSPVTAAAAPDPAQTVTGTPDR